VTPVGTDKVMVGNRVDVTVLDTTSIAFKRSVLSPGTYKGSTWQLSYVAGKLTYDESLKGWISSRTSSTSPTLVRHISVSKFKYDKYQLQILNGLALDIEVSNDSGGFIAYNDGLGVYGVGATFDKAVSDFEQALIEYYLNITDCSEDILGESALKFRKTLENFATLTVNE